MRFPRFGGPLLLISALGLAGCAADLSAPEVDAAELAAGVRADDGRGAGGSYTPVLVRLFRSAIAQLEREGSAGAAARAARAATDVERASVIVRVMGAPVVERVMSSVATDLRALKARLARAAAAGSGNPRLEALAQRVERLLNAAQGSYRAGRPAAALDLAADAFDLLAGVRR